MQLAKTSATKISLLPKNTLQPFNIEDDKKQFKFQKDLIRAMATEMYHMYCLASLSGIALITQLDRAGGTGRCPWQAILKRPRDFINHKTYLPRKVLYDTSGQEIKGAKSYYELEEPSNMNKLAIRAILRKWKPRQDEGKVLFAFKAYQHLGQMFNSPVMLESILEETSEPEPGTNGANIDPPVRKKKPCQQKVATKKAKGIVVDGDDGDDELESNPL
jgi:hypothetical protein